MTLIDVKNDRKVQKWGFLPCKIYLMSCLRKMLINSRIFVTSSYGSAMFGNPGFYLSASLSYICFITILTINLIYYISFILRSPFIFKMTQTFLKCIRWYIAQFYIERFENYVYSFRRSFNIRCWNVFQVGRLFNSIIISQASSDFLNGSCWVAITLKNIVNFLIFCLN